MEHGTHPERFGDWYDYLKRERSKARYMGLQQEFICATGGRPAPSVDRPQALLRRDTRVSPIAVGAGVWGHSVLPGCVPDAGFESEREDAGSVCRAPSLLWNPGLRRPII